MKKQETLFNGLPLNENQTCTYIDQTWYNDYNQIYGPGSSPYYFDHLIPTIETPEVYITKNKSRLKKYDPYNVYLNDGDEFEFEIFNNTIYTVGVKFKINNEYISLSHLILYPGQRIFLDRYLDTDKKFKFSTYNVEANNKKVEQAIRFNGDVEIEFYKKIEVKQNNILRSNFPTYGNTNDIIGTQVMYSAVLDDLSDLNTNFKSTSFVETGRIDEGSKSDQNFDYVNMSFETNKLFNFRFKILPTSQKPIEAKDLKPTCSGCKRKGKKNDRFCSHCGTKF